MTEEGYIVDWVLDGTQAWNYLENQKKPYTLVIFDWLLPGISGLELLRKLQTRNSNLPVLMLTAKNRLENKVAGLDTGADDYLVKPFGMAEPLARLRALQRRSPQIQPQQLQVGNLVVDCGNRTVYHLARSGKSQIIYLKNKKFQLIEYFIKHLNQIVNTDPIPNQLWEVSADTFSNVVAAQVRLLRRKLESVGGANLIETVHGVGYRMRN